MASVEAFRSTETDCKYTLRTLKRRAFGISFSCTKLVLFICSLEDKSSFMSSVASNLLTRKQYTKICILKLKHSLVASYFKVIKHLIAPDHYRRHIFLLVVKLNFMTFFTAIYDYLQYGQIWQIQQKDSPNFESQNLAEFSNTNQNLECSIHRPLAWIHVHVVATQDEKPYPIFPLMETYIHRFFGRWISYISTLISNPYSHPYI